jgi:tRNA pseudouridine38-40 synthase
MPHFKLTIAYDGTGLVGWQRQASGVSIQGLLEEALSALDGREVAVAGAGRTDAGVHALAQVATASLERVIDGHSVVRALNTRLPDSVRVLDASEVPVTFHARFTARSKTYRYRIWNGDVLPPFERRYAWHVPAPPLDVGAMAAAALLLHGSHDYAAFQGTGTEPHSTERIIFSSSIRTVDEAMRAAGESARGVGDTDRMVGALIAYEICGNGFLRHMVRNIVGTLVEVGRRRRPVAWVEEVLRLRARARAGPTAPAEGLFLVSVDYEQTP